jgi:hypothetical protein
MIYRGFNKNEMSRITAILNRSRVAFSVTIPDASLEFIHDPTKRVSHKFLDNLLQIEIDKGEFDKINPADLKALYDLRIYKEEKPPFTDEELSSLDEQAEMISESKNSDYARMNQVASLLALLITGFMFLKKQGLF